MQLWFEFQTPPLSSPRIIHLHIWTVLHTRKSPSCSLHVASHQGCCRFHRGSCSSVVDCVEHGGGGGCGCAGGGDGGGGCTAHVVGGGGIAGDVESEQRLLAYWRCLLLLLLLLLPMVMLLMLLHQTPFFFYPSLHNMTTRTPKHAFDFVQCEACTLLPTVTRTCMMLRARSSKGASSRAACSMRCICDGVNKKLLVNADNRCCQKTAEDARA